MTSIAAWLDGNGLGELQELFLANDLDLDVVVDLTEADLRELGLNLGQRKRLVRAIASLRQARQAVPPPGLPTRSDVSAERRHLTVMFVDLVGSTALGERMDSEDYLELIQHYRAHCHETIARYGGFIARFVGDGILCYFGFPTALGNDAERAVRAGLEITRTLGGVEVPGGVRLQARVGLATGVVIIGDLLTSDAADRQSVVGAIPNLAARIHSLARADEVVISESTYRLVRGFFACEAMGASEMKGLAAPVATWRVRAERAVASRFQAVRGERARSGMVNRFEELADLRARWRATLDGVGGGVIIVGEPGLGKSRLLQHFLETLDQPGATILRFTASPFTGASPLQPLTAALTRAARIRRGDDPAARRAKVAGLLRGEAQVVARDLPLFLRLFSVPEEAPSGLAPTPEQIRDQTFAALIAQLRARADVGPVLITVEDIHWLDPSSLDLIELVAQWAKRLRVFIVLTCRSGEMAEWLGQCGLPQLVLSHFEENHARALLRNVLGDRALPLALQAQILAKTDGIPLFVEEIARTLAEAPTIPTGGSSIPDSLQETLIARLDQAGPGKELAQIGSVLGRSFGRSLLETVAAGEPIDVGIALEALVGSGLLLREEGSDGEPEAFSFKHALVQDAAYGTMLRDRRRVLHLRAGEALEALTPEVRDEQPELLARHYDEAAQPARAVPHFLRAARKAASRSALREAVVLLRQALAAIGGLPAGEQARAWRLEALTLLGPALMNLVGPGSSEVSDVYSEAVALCGEMPDSAEHFPVYWGWWRLSTDVTDRDRRFRSMLARAKERNDPGMLLQAHHCGWASHFVVADFAACHAHIDAGLEIYHGGDYRSHAALYGGHDAKVCGHCEKALLLWIDGFPEQALEEERKAFAWAQELGHDGSLSHVAEAAVNHHAYRRDLPRVTEHARALIALGEERGFGDYLSKGRIFLGWATALQSDVAGGLAMMRDGIAQQKQIGTVEDFPIYFCLFADALEAAGLADEGLDELLAMREICEKGGYKLWLPEVWRGIGRLGRVTGRMDEAECRAAVETAEAMAREQGVRVLALRAALTLAEWDRGAGRVVAAMARLRPYLDGAPEWSANAEVVAARALAEEIARGVMAEALP